VDRCGLVLYASGQGPAADTYEDIKELFSSVRSVTFLDELRDSLRVMKGRDPFNGPHFWFQSAMRGKPVLVGKKQTTPIAVSLFGNFIGYI
jgi:hypothetical protein